MPQLILTHPSTVIEVPSPVRLFSRTLKVKQQRAGQAAPQEHQSKRLVHQRAEADERFHDVVRYVVPNERIQRRPLRLHALLASQRFRFARRAVQERLHAQRRNGVLTRLERVLHAGERVPDDALDDEIVRNSQSILDGLKIGQVPIPKILAPGMKDLHRFVYH